MPEDCLKQQPSHIYILKPCGLDTVKYQHLSLSNVAQFLAVSRLVFIRISHIPHLWHVP